MEEGEREDERSKEALNMRYLRRMQSLVDITKRTRQTGGSVEWYDNCLIDIQL